MRALTVTPQKPGSLAVADVPEPQPGPDDLLVEALALGVCGTDREIVDGEYGWPPDGQERLILGHESLGRVVAAPSASGFTAGDLVAGVVRRPDDVPCPACARGEFDMCRNGMYTERGIKQLNGFGSQRWVTEPAYAVKLAPGLEDVGVLLEPTSVVAKAWDHIERIGSRAWYEPEHVLVTGAGPIGLLAALLGVERGLDVHVLDQAADGLKPRLVRDLGATYHTGTVQEVVAAGKPDIIIETTAAPPVVLAALRGTGNVGICCLVGVSPNDRLADVDAGAINREIVLENDVVFGSVNANPRHYAAAAEALAAADRDWLAAMITRRVPLERCREAFEPRPGDVKVVVDLKAA
jgi:threonine dehydrogenase-like Zn-dependent dehydrogenase